MPGNPHDYSIFTTDFISCQIEDTGDRSQDRLRPEGLLDQLQDYLYHAGLGLPKQKQEGMGSSPQPSECTSGSPSPILFSNTLAFYADPPSKYLCSRSIGWMAALCPGHTPLSPSWGVESCCAPPHNAC